MKIELGFELACASKASSKRMIENFYDNRNFIF